MLSKILKGVVKVGTHLYGDPVIQEVASNALRSVMATRF